MDRRLLVLAVGMFAVGTDNFVIAGILPSISSSLNTSASAAGQMVSIYALSFAILAPVVAAVVGGWSRKFLRLSALGIFVVGNALSAVATDLNTVLISRALAGLGAAMFAPTALGAAASLVATALGAPIGTFIGGLGGWRGTLWSVAALGLIAMIGVSLMLRTIPTPPRITLRERLRPLHDSRIALTLLTTLFAYGGLLMVYTYIGLTFDHVTRGDIRVLAGMLFLWGVAATAGNLLSGRLVDRFGSREIINGALIVGAINFAALPWTSAHMGTALVSVAIWGISGWGLNVPQQHRLVTLAPHVAALLLALNNTALYAGLACSGLLGGIVILVIDVHYLSLVGSASIFVALVMAELAHLRIIRRASAESRETADV
jgi:DHA1 family inner membrane transport protein